MDEPLMYRNNGSSREQSKGVATDMGELTHDIVSLAELQFELFRSDCREGLRGLPIPLGLLFSAGVLAAGIAPIVLLSFAECLVSAGGISRAVALLIAASIGLMAVVLLGLLGWQRIRFVARMFERSREEFVRNGKWIKNTLKQSASANGHLPPDRT